MKTTIQKIFDILWIISLGGIVFISAEQLYVGGDIVFVLPIIGAIFWGICKFLKI